MKKLLYTFILLSVLVSCKHESKLQKEIGDINKECPFSLGMAGVVSNIKLVDNNVVVDVILNEQVASIDIISTDPELTKTDLLSSYTSEASMMKEVLQEMLEENVGMTINYEGNISHNTATINISVDDIKEALEKGPEDPSIFLDKQVKMTNSMFPKKVDSATTLEKMSIEDKYVVYDYTVFDSILSIKDMIESEETIRLSLINNFKMNESSMRYFLDCCIACDKGLAYRYKGVPSDDEFTVTFEPNELKW